MGQLKNRFTSKTQIKQHKSTELNLSQIIVINIFAQLLQKLAMTRLIAQIKLFTGEREMI